ncbi:hypothetical protein [Psychromonas sp. Urea-02u-13]
MAQDGDEIDILVQRRKDKKTTMRFFQRLLKGEATTPRRYCQLKLK